jgi:predicted RNA-binding Zn-ribbon protein involved in translation (DUF1610 family)
MKQTEVQWICTKCGEKIYKRKVDSATWHKDICGICKTEQIVTEPRDFRNGVKKKYLKTHKCQNCLFKGACFKHAKGYICDKCDSWCKK